MEVYAVIRPNEIADAQYAWLHGVDSLIGSG
jgi:hypothetical protein